MYAHKNQKAGENLRQNQNTLSIEEYNSKYWQHKSNTFMDILDELRINCGKVKVIYSDTPIIGYNKSDDTIYIDEKFLNSLIISYKIGYHSGIAALMYHEIGHRTDLLKEGSTSEVSAELNSIRHLGIHPEEGLSQQISISMFTYAGRDSLKAIDECNKRISLYGISDHFGEKAANYIASKAMLYYRMLIGYGKHTSKNNV